MATAYDNWLEGDCGVNDSAEAHGEAVEAKIDELRADPEAMAEADSRLSGDLPEVAYAGLEGWLATIGDMLPPSGRVYADDLGKLPQHVVARLAEAARIASAARMTVLRDMAEAQIKREEEASWKAYGELLAEAAA